jgi:hypothetical protein
VAKQGRGRSGGYRMIVAFKAGRISIFVYGFAKNELDNIDDKQLALLRTFADIWLAASDKRIDDEVEAKRLFEV